MKRPGVQVRGRDGYVAPLRNERPAPPRPAPANMSAGLAAAMATSNRRHRIATPGLRRAVQEKGARQPWPSRLSRCVETESRRASRSARRHARSQLLVHRHAQQDLSRPDLHREALAQTRHVRTRIASRPSGSDRNPPATRPLSTASRGWQPLHSVRKRDLRPERARLREGAADHEWRVADIGREFRDADPRASEPARRCVAGPIT